jgi:HD-GYP domain-containing protein (c-di-GMP phosphodiesterase class II)
MTPNDLNEYRQHSVRGQAAIDSIEDLRHAGLLIRHHHENFDGSGFPDRLAKGDIPLGSRVINMADYSDRLFVRNRGDNAIEMTLKMVKEELGGKFDPDLFPLMEKSFQEMYEKLSAKTGMTMMELQPKELQEGMIIAGDVRSGTGLLLLGTGERLDFANISALKRYYNIDPPRKGILVRVQSNR